MSDGRSRLRLPLLLDGATGTEYMKAGMPSGVCLEQWASEHPQVVRDTIAAYADAGSDVVYAPTFLANAGGLALYGLEGHVAELNAALVSQARSALAGRETLLAGDMSTTGLICEPFGEATFSRMVELYAEQSAVLAKAGVDLLVIETISSMTEARAAVLGTRGTGLPMIVSLTVDRTGKTMWGDDILTALVVLQELGIDAFGLNCSQGPEDMLPIFERIAPYAKIPLLAKPNAGEPPLTPVQFSDRCARLLRRGVQLIGGCCGTTPEHIVALRHMLDTFDVSRVKTIPAEYELLAAGHGGVHYLTNDLEYSEPVTCSVDMADDLIDASGESCDAVLIRLDAVDDGYIFSLNAHMLDKAAAFESESLEALESALMNYQGRALVVSTGCELEKSELEPLAEKYGAIVM